MDLKEELKKMVMEIKDAPDSDDVGSIIKDTIEDLIDENITGVELQLSILFIQQEVRQKMSEAEDYIELNSLKRGLDYIEQIGNALGLHTFNFDLN